MRFKYTTTDPSQDEFDSLPRIPFILRNDGRVAEVVGLVDSGAMVSVLPYRVGLELGEVWDDSRATMRLTGSAGSRRAIPLIVTAEIEGLATITLAFGWVQEDDVPVILGQTNFFMEFDISFFRSRLEFEVKPKSIN